MDNLIKALIRNERIRVYIANSTDTVNEAIRIHDLWPSAASVLGKTMTVGVIMGAMLKGDEAVTIKLDGNGQIGQVIVDSNAKGEVRGYVTNPHVHFSRNNRLDDVTTLGYNGYIDVIKDLKMKELYQSSIPIETGDIAKDFTFYFASSEQTPTLTSLGITMKEDNTCEVCGGIIVQLLPNALEEDIQYLEGKTKEMENFSQLLREHPQAEEILNLLFGNDVKILGRLPVSFQCGCSKEKFAVGIATIGKDEIQNIIDTDGHAEVICHYCRKKYDFNEEELKAIREESKK